MRENGLCTAAQIGPAAGRVSVKMPKFFQEFAKFLTTLCCGCLQGLPSMSTLWNTGEDAMWYGTRRNRIQPQLSPSHGNARGSSGNWLCQLDFGLAKWRRDLVAYRRHSIGFGYSLHFLIIMRVNKQLLDPALDKGSGKAQELLSRWGKFHAVRSTLSGIAVLNNKKKKTRIRKDTQYAYCKLLL